VWFQEMTCATDTLLEHTVHDVSNNRHVVVFVIPGMNLELGPCI